MAKLAALTLNGQKMVSKKGSFYAEDLWNLKYLPKFKWHHLTERLAHEERLKKERLKVELEQEKKIDEFYSEKLIKSKKINGII
jgi:ESF2/ABP1 family protein